MKNTKQKYLINYLDKLGNLKTVEKNLTPPEFDEIYDDIVAKGGKIEHFKTI